MSAPDTTITPTPTPELTPTPAPTPDAAAERLAAIEARLAELQAENVKKDNLIQRYQIELGNRPAPAVSPANPADKFDDDSKQFVRSEAQRMINDTVARLSLTAEVNQKAADPDVAAAAKIEFQSLKSSPFWRGNSDEILWANAVDRARASVFEKRLAEVRTNAKAQADSAAAASGRLPHTPQSQFRKTTDTADPDADIKEWMNQPESQYMFHRFIEGGKNIDPFSDTPCRMQAASSIKFEPAKDIFKRMAIKAVRTGVNLSERMRGMAGADGMVRIEGGM